MLGAQQREAGGLAGGCGSGRSFLGGVERSSVPAVPLTPCSPAVYVRVKLSSLLAAELRWGLF